MKFFCFPSSCEAASQSLSSHRLRTSHRPYTIPIFCSLFTHTSAVCSASWLIRSRLPILLALSSSQTCSLPFTLFYSLKMDNPPFSEEYSPTLYPIYRLNAIYLSFFFPTILLPSSFDLNDNRKWTINHAPYTVIKGYKQQQKHKPTSYNFNISINSVYCLFSMEDYIDWEMFWSGTDGFSGEQKLYLAKSH